MKLAILALACFVAATQAQRNSASAFASNFGSFGRGRQNQPFRSQPYKPPSAVVVNPTPAYVAAPAPAPARAYANAYTGDARSANILKYGNDINPDGSYSHFFETDNGIAAQAQGTPRSLGGNPPVVPVVAQGSFSWTSPEGTPIVISYIADENGYQPQGDAIPTPPPVPEAILRSLEYIARSAPRQ